MWRKLIIALGGPHAVFEACGLDGLASDPRPTRDAERRAGSSASAPASVAGEVPAPPIAAPPVAARLDAPRPGGHKIVKKVHSFRYERLKSRVDDSAKQSA